MRLFSLLKTPIIEFLCAEEDLGIVKEPLQAGKCIPDWYKKIPTHTNVGRDHFGGVGMTAKKCLPMIDAMTLGFVIPLYGDVNIRTNKDNSLIEASNNPYGGAIVEFHGLDQLGGKTSPSYPGKAIKFINRWIIKTAPGYSTLFVPCLNSMEARFTVLSALVDTDKYHKQVNFPAIWNVPNYDGVIEAGTPIITAIPIRRNDFNKEPILRPLTEKEEAKRRHIEKSQHVRNHYYTNELREKR